MKHLLLILGLSMAFPATGFTRDGWSGLYRKPDGSFVGIGKLHEFGKADVFVASAAIILRDSSGRC
jgi:hypothetical protein